MIDNIDFLEVDCIHTDCVDCPLFLVNRVCGYERVILDNEIVMPYEAYFED